MSRSFDGSGDFLDGASAVSAEPLTIACWATLSALGSNRVLFDVAASASTNNAYRVGLNTSNNILGITQVTAAGLSIATSTTAVGAADTWFHAAAVFASDTDRRAFLDGGGKGTNTVSRNPSAVDSVTFGDRVSHAQTSPHAGLIAHAGMWNIALTDAEILWLATGIDPRLVRPDSLVGYWPLFGNNSPEPDWVGGNNLTVTQTAKSESAPRIFLPARKRLILPRAATPQTVVPDVATITGSATDTTIALGAVTQLVDVATVTGSGADAAVVLGAVTQIPAVATVAASAADPAVVITGTATVLPGVATVAGAAIDTTIVLGAVAQPVADATVTGSAADAAIVLGAVTQAVAVATVTGSAIDTTIAVGPVSQVVTAATVIIAAVDSTASQPIAVAVASVVGSASDSSVVLGAVTQAVGVATVTGSATDASIALGPVAVIPAVATVTGSAVDTTIALGPVSQAPDPATVTITASDSTGGSAVLVTVEQAVVVINANPLIVVDVLPATVVVGANQTVVPDAAIVAVSAVDPTPSQTILVAVDPATVTGSAVDCLIALGAVSPAVNVATVAVGGVDSGVAVGPVSQAVGAATVTGSAVDATVSLGALLVAVLDAAVAVLVADPTPSLGGVSVQPQVATVTIAGTDAKTDTIFRTPDVATVSLSGADASIFQWPSFGQRQPGSIYRPQRRAEADTQIRRPDGPDQFPYRQQ